MFKSFFPLFFLLRSLSELEGVKLGGDTGDKIRQVTERATLFRITSNAMINVSHPQMQQWLCCENCCIMLYNAIMKLGGC